MTHNRRSFLSGSLAVLTLAAGGGTAAFAQTTPGSGRFVLVILRGAMDGLAAIIPHREPNYRALRGEIALPEPGAAGGTLALTEGFGLHPALTNLHDLWKQRQMSFMHAASSPYRERSHFDGQDVLEQGGGGEGSLRDGWLNRALRLAGGPGRDAVAIGRTVPLVLRGPAPASSWAPPLAPEADQDTLARLMDLYAGDPMLGTALSRAVATDAIAGDMMAAGMDAQARNQRGSFVPLAQAAAQLMAAPGGPGVCVLSFDGWDTHFRQGGSDGLLAGRLSQLDRAIGTLKTGLGPLWASTTVVIATEFGRTARVNGTGGTDHGTGGAAFVLGGNLGGSVAGGRMLGDWPGLSCLYQDRDLMPANDIRTLFAGAMSHAWGISTDALNRQVFQI